MFCSNKCYQKSFKRFHHYECPIMDQLLKSGSVHIILRLFFVALSTFNGSIRKLEMFLKDFENETKAISDFDLTLRDGQSDKNLLLALMSLIRSSHRFPLHQHEEILKNHPTLHDIWKENQEFIASFLLRQCQISDLSFHGIFSGTSRKSESRSNSEFLSSMQQPIGSGALLFCSGINHSCANNVFRICTEGKVVYVVCRSIPKGSQLFDCYK